MTRSVALLSHVVRYDAMLVWLDCARQGDILLYHIGLSIAADRVRCPDLDAMADLAAILRDRGVVHLSQRRHDGLPGIPTAFMATHTGRMRYPAKIIDGTITPREYLALMTIRDRDAHTSANRAVRDRFSVSDAAATALVDRLRDAGLLETQGKSCSLSDSGERAIG